MPRPGILSSATRRLVSAMLLLLSASLATAQHHGGHNMGTGMPGGNNRPDGVDEKDTLKDFHHAVAVQATTQQIAEFQAMVKSTTAAQDKVRAFQTAADKSAREGTTPLDQMLDDARTRTRNFQQGFSEPQKSGLKELTRHLEKADADLDQEAKRFDQSIKSESASADVSAHAAILGKSLTDFSNAQLALGREMGITLASGQDVAFTLPKVRSQISIGSRTIAVDVSSELSQTASQADQRTFQLETTVDLSELQQSITEILNARLYSAGCGERLSVNRATIVPATPASTLALQLHYERWSCMGRAGQSSMNEVAESNGSVEIKLTPAFGDANALHLAPEFKRIDATGMMADDLRSGDLGDFLRDKVSAAILPALLEGANFKAIMPGVLQSGVTLEAARFQDPSGSGLKSVFEGHVHLSNDQVNLLASQLNQTLSAQGSPAPAPPAPTQQTK